MALPPHQEYLTEAQYLAYEDESDLRHEYANGQIIAMTGASWTHNLICVNTSTSLNVQLMNKNCRVTSGDLRLKVSSRRHYRYLDVMVICGEPQFVANRVDTISNPVVVIEVLSESTALTDRNDKLEEYLQVDSVQEYVLISQSEPRIERYLRQTAGDTSGEASGDWLYSHASGLQNSIDLPSIGCTLALADVYNKVDLSAEQAPPDA